MAAHRTQLAPEPSGGHVWKDRRVKVERPGGGASKGPFARAAVGRGSGGWFRRSSTNILKDMCARNRPNFNTGNGLTSNGGCARGAPPGSAPEGRAAGSPRASTPAIRQLLAPATSAEAEGEAGGSGGLAADIGELTAPPGRPNPDAGVGVAQAAAALGTQACSRSGTAVSNPDVEMEVLPTASAGARLEGGWLEVPAAAARARAFTLSPGGLAASG